MAAVDGVGMEADAFDSPEDADMDCVEEEVECVLDDRPQRVRMKRESAPAASQLTGLGASAAVHDP